MEELEDAGGEGSGLHCVHGSMELCNAANRGISWASGLGGEALGDRRTETAMQHFHAENRHKIKDAPPNTWATVHCRDVVTRSELARRGFHLVDMSGEVWTMRREG